MDWHTQPIRQNGCPQAGAESVPLLKESEGRAGSSGIGSLAVSSKSGTGMSRSRRYLEFLRVFWMIASLDSLPIFLSVPSLISSKILLNKPNSILPIKIKMKSCICTKWPIHSYTAKPTRNCMAWLKVANVTNNTKVDRKYWYAERFWPLSANMDIRIQSQSFDALDSADRLVSWRLIRLHDNNTYLYVVTITAAAGTDTCIQ